MKARVPAGSVGTADEVINAGETGGSAISGWPLVDAAHLRALRLDPAMWSHLGSDDRRARVIELVRSLSPLLADDEVSTAAERVLARVGGLGPLEPLLADARVTEVMVNGDGRVFVEREGRVESTGIVMDEPLVLHLIERIIAPLGLTADRSNPTVDARLADGSRVNAIVRPIAIDGPCLTIRRFGVRSIPVEEFASAAVADLLRWAVAARGNILVSGGTGSGKTTLLNALAAAIPPGERIITVEDTAELQLRSDHVVRLETRAANADGQGALRVRDLVRNALRMRPDRIVVGEVRGDEALDMLQAMNTGHEGSLSTCHANSPGDALRRIETMVLTGAVDLPSAAIREQIRSSIDLVVQVERRRDGRRGISAIDEVVDDTDARDRLTTIALSDGQRVLREPTRPVRACSVGGFPVPAAPAVSDASAPR